MKSENKNLYEIMQKTKNLVFELFPYLYIYIYVIIVLGILSFLFYYENCIFIFIFFIMQNAKICRA